MKKILNTLALLLIAFAAFGQKTTTSWPYLYSDFANGTVYMKDGKKHDQEFNIHLAKGRLHFNDNGVIKEVKTNDIHLVELNGELFTSLQGFVVKVIGDPQTGYVAVHTYADYQKLNESDGPYGTKLDATTSYSVTPYDLTGVAGAAEERLLHRGWRQSVQRFEKRHRKQPGRCRQGCIQNFPETEQDQVAGSAESSPARGFPKSALDDEASQDNVGSGGGVAAVVRVPEKWN